MGEWPKGEPMGRDSCRQRGSAPDFEVISTGIGSSTSSATRSRWTSTATRAKGARAYRDKATSGGTTSSFRTEAIGAVSQGQWTCAATGPIKDKPHDSISSSRTTTTREIHRITVIAIADSPTRMKKIKHPFD